MMRGVEVVGWLWLGERSPERYLGSNAANVVEEVSMAAKKNASKAKKKAPAKKTAKKKK
jgi:hypothetical protein